MALQPEQYKLQSYKIHFFALTLLKFSCLMVKNINILIQCIKCWFLNRITRFLIRNHCYLRKKEDFENQMCQFHRF